MRGMRSQNLQLQLRASAWPPDRLSSVLCIYDTVFEDGALDNKLMPRFGEPIPVRALSLSCSCPTVGTKTARDLDLLHRPITAAKWGNDLD
jgi:hypothetical protein